MNQCTYERGNVNQLDWPSTWGEYYLFQARGKRGFGDCSGRGNVKIVDALADKPEVE